MCSFLARVSNARRTEHILPEIKTQTYSSRRIDRIDRFRVERLACSDDTRGRIPRQHGDDVRIIARKCHMDRGKSRVVQYRHTLVQGHSRKLRTSQAFLLKLIAS